MYIHALSYATHVIHWNTPSHYSFFEDDASTSIEENPCWVNKELTHCVYYLVLELVVNTISNSMMYAFHKNQTNVHYCFKIDFACLYFIRAVISLCTEDGCTIRKWSEKYSQKLHSKPTFLVWSIFVCHIICPENSDFFSVWLLRVSVVREWMECSIQILHT